MDGYFEPSLAVSRVLPEAPPFILNGKWLRKKVLEQRLSPDDVSLLHSMLVALSGDAENPRQLSQSQETERQLQFDFPHPIAPSMMLTATLTIELGIIPSVTRVVIAEGSQTKIDTSQKQPASAHPQADRRRFEAKFRLGSEELARARRGRFAPLISARKAAIRGPHGYRGLTGADRAKVGKYAGGARTLAVIDAYWEELRSVYSAEEIVAIASRAHAAESVLAVVIYYHDFCQTGKLDEAQFHAIAAGAGGGKTFSALEQRWDELVSTFSIPQIVEIAKAGGESAIHAAADHSPTLVAETTLTPSQITEILRRPGGAKALARIRNCWTPLRQKNLEGGDIFAIAKHAGASLTLQLVADEDWERDLTKDEMLHLASHYCASERVAWFLAAMKTYRHVEGAREVLLRAAKNKEKWETTLMSLDDRRTGEEDDISR